MKETLENFKMYYEDLPSMEQIKQRTHKRKLDLAEKKRRKMIVAKRRATKMLAAATRKRRK